MTKLFVTKYIAYFQIKVNLGLAGFICSMFAVGMAVGVIIGVGILFVVQVFMLINMS